MSNEKNQPDTSEPPSIRLWNYIFENCGCQYIRSERAYSAYMFLCCYDYQAWELDEHSARVKLANRLFCDEHILEWFMKKFNIA